MRFVLVLFCLAVSGCLPVPARSRAPAAIVTAGGASVTQTGEAQAPAQADTRTDRAAFTLPAGSEVWRDEKLGALVYRLSRDTMVETETRAESVKAPQAFTPPAPPTPSDVADGRATWVYRIGLVIGIAAAVFGLVRNWDFVMWGGAAVAAACGFGLFVQRHPALFGVIGGGAAIAAAGVLVWHLKLKRLPTQTA